jgi:surface protein
MIVVMVSGQDFITKWKFDAAATSITFNTLTTGKVNYTWTALPSGNTGTGSFSAITAGAEQVTLSGLSIPAGNSVTLAMAPENLRRFYSSADRFKLIDVIQWGSVSWSSMNSAFYECIQLNITAKDVPNLYGVTDMKDMFNRAQFFNQDIGNWNTSNVTNMSGMFSNAVHFNQDIGNWNTSNVTNMSGMFSNADRFNQNIGNWNTSNVTNMSSMFKSAGSFNQDIGKWNVGNVKTMYGMFEYAGNFNQDIGKWNTSKVTNVERMFFEAASFNQDIGNWDTRNITTMSSMFEATGNFNQDIGKWNTSNVFSMASMFARTTYFNQDIGKWNTSNVANMERMFDRAASFNQDISNWNTFNVTNMRNMFLGTLSFNQDIGKWNTSNVTNMSYMFSSAESFNQNIGTWNLSRITSMDGMLDDSGMDCDNYSATLIGWNKNNAETRSIKLGAKGLKYGLSANQARNELGFKNWIIEGDVETTNLCVPSPDKIKFITHWNFITASTSISFNALTTGQVDYIWRALPSGNEGTGSFNTQIAGPVTLSGLNIPANNIVTLSMAPEKLRRFYASDDDSRPLDRVKLIDVSQWGSVAWSSMEFAFFGCENFNITALDKPNLSNVNDMSSMFNGARIFNSDIVKWNPINVEDFSHMFSRAIFFNQPIERWNTNNVTNMASMFEGATSFNQPLGNWKASKVKRMDYMFSNATSFNGFLQFNLYNVEDMSGMFSGAIAFNRRFGLGSSVKSVFAMFRNAKSFNQHLGILNTNNVTNMASMFEGASSFNQSLGLINTTNVTNMDNMLLNCNMDCDNYTSTLIGWNKRNTGSIPRVVGVRGLVYSINAKLARNTLISKGWTIQDDIETFATCGYTPTNEISNINIKVYPNPVSNKISIETELSEAVTIYNAMGIKISTHDIKEGINELEFNHVSGLYLLEFEKSRKSIKVMKI